MKKVADSEIASQYFGDTALANGELVDYSNREHTPALKEVDNLTSNLLNTNYFII